SGQTMQLACTIRSRRTGEVVTGQSVTWSSADATIAAVAPDGTVTALQDGTTQITCSTADGQSGSATVTVTTPITLEIDPSQVTLRTGETATLVCTVRNANTGEVITGRQLTWTSSNTDVATVMPVTASDALVSAGSDGTATI